MAAVKTNKASVSDYSGMAYPGRPVAQGEKDKALVKAVQTRLNARGCGPLEVDGDFGTRTRNAVRLFQIRFPDGRGQALAADGVVGSLTWAALFGTKPVARPRTANSLAGRALKAAASEIGVMEDPPGSNRGPRVDEYLRATGLDPADGSYAWCAAFVYWCFGKACRKGETNPLIKTAGVLKHWNRAIRGGVPKLTAAEALGNPALIRPGCIFVIDAGGGLGHMGFVESVEDGILATIEGNTNDLAEREGIGVFRRTRRTDEINKGYLDYA